MDTLLSRPKKKGQGARYSQNSLSHPKSEPDLNEMDREEELRIEQLSEDEVNEKFEQMLVSEMKFVNIAFTNYVATY